MNNRTWLILAAIVAAFFVMKFLMKPGASEKMTAKEKIRQGALVIDVRSPGEFADGHYEGAKNIPVSEIASRTGELGDKSRAIVVYCAAGVRAAQAKAALVKAGFTDVSNAGGLSDLGQ